MLVSSYCSCSPLVVTAIVKNDWFLTMAVTTKGELCYLLFGRSCDYSRNYCCNTGNTLIEERCHGESTHTVLQLS